MSLPIDSVDDGSAIRWYPEGASAHSIGLSDCLPSAASLHHCDTVHAPVAPLSYFSGGAWGAAETGEVAKKHTPWTEELGSLP